MMPTSQFRVSLSKVMQELSLDVINMCGDPDKIMISSMDVNRPGLELNRFFDYYDTSRIVIFGNAETAFLASMDPAERAKVLDELFSQKPPGRDYCARPGAGPGAAGGDQTE